MRRYLRGFLLLAMMLAASGAGIVQVVRVADAASAAQATGTIEIHARICDQVPVDGDWFGACHDNASADTFFDAMETTTGEVVSGTTGASGNVTLIVGTGTWELFGPPGEFISATFIYCSTGTNTPEVAHPVTIRDGSAVVCDYYFVPEDLSGGGTIEVHARMCDAVPANNDWFNTCHDDIAPNVYFDAIETSTNANYFGTTGASGNLLFNLPPGTWQLSGPPGDFLKETFIYCSFGENTDRIAHPVALEPGDAVICDYYFVPDPQGPTPTVAPTAVPPTPAPTVVPRKPVLELPVVLVAGSCENVTNATEIVADLTDAVVLEGAAQGSDDALQAAVGYTQVSLSLNTIMASDHVIAVVDPEDDSRVVACGAIGGVPDGQGAFTIGLAPVDDSGVAGTAYLASRGSSATGISVFVVPEGLIPEVPLEPIG